jgi:hypothetical protein
MKNHIKKTSMLLATIRFTKDQAMKYGLTETLIGRPGCGESDDHYCLEIYGPNISVGGYSTIDFFEQPDGKNTKIKKILSAVTKMIQSDDFVHQLSEVTIY